MRRKILGLSAATALLFTAACSADSDPGTGSNDDPGSSEDLSYEEVVQKYVDMGGEEAVDALREALDGQSIVITSSSFPNPQIVTTQRGAEMLEEMFGVDVKFDTADSDPLIAAMIAGQVDVGEISLAGMASANESGSDFVAFGATDKNNLFMIVAKSDITELSQVKGETFAVTQNLSQITGQTAQKCLADAGMSLDDINLLHLGNGAETTQAIEADQVAVGLSATYRMTPLYLANGVDHYSVLCKGWEMNPQNGDVWFATRDWVEQNPEMALALNIAQIATHRWLTDDRQAWIDYAMGTLQNYTQEMGEIDYDQLVDELDDWPVNGSLDREIAEKTLETSLEFEAITQETEVDEVVTFLFQDAAVEILGAR